MVLEVAGMGVRRPATALRSRRALRTVLSGLFQKQSIFNCPGRSFKKQKEATSRLPKR